MNRALPTPYNGQQRLVPHEAHEGCGFEISVGSALHAPLSRCDMPLRTQDGGVTVRS